MKKILSTFLMCTLLLISVNTLNVEAANINKNLPKEVIEEMEKTNENIEILEEGVYKVGEHLFVDLSIVELEDIETQGIQPFATSMPTSVWDWARGSYSADYSMSYTILYTSYGFTGYSKYSVYASETSRDPSEHINAGYIGLELRAGKNKGYVVSSAESYGRGYIGISFINCDPGTVYAFAVTKTNDGSTSKGFIEVNK